MEYALEAQEIAASKDSLQGLNPCFYGICSRRRASNGEKTQMKSS